MLAHSHSPRRVAWRHLNIPSISATDMHIDGQKRLGSGTLIALILMLCFFPPLSTDMFLSDMPNMAVELGTDPSTMNMVLYGFMLSLAVSILIFGPVTDRFGRRPVLLAALVEYIAVSIAGSMAQDVWSLIACRVLQGIGAGACMTVSTALIKDCFTGDRMKKVLNLSAVLGVLAPLVAPVLGSWIITVSDWRMTMIAPTAVGFACLAIVLFLTETVSDGQRESASLSDNFREIGKIVSDRAFSAFLLLVTVFSAAFMAYLSVSSYIYEEYFGLGAMEYAGFLAAALIAGTVLMFPVNRIWGACGGIKVLWVYLGLVVLSGVLMFAIGHRGALPFLIAFLPCITVTTAIRPYGMGIILGSHDGDNGLVSALINFMMFVTGVVGMVCSTMFSDYIHGLGIIMFAASAVFALMWIALRKMGYDRIRCLK